MRNFPRRPAADAGTRAKRHSVQECSLAWKGAGPRGADPAIAVAVWAVVQPGGSAGAKLEVEHDGAAGGVVRDVRARRLTLRGRHRCTVRGRIVEVGLEHAEIR